MYSVGVTSTSFSRNPKLRDELLSLTKNVRFNESGRTLSGEELKSFLGDRNGAIVGLEKIDEGLLQACPQLKVIAKYGVGLDNVDLEACRRHSVEVGWTAGVNAYAVAEQTIGMMIGLARNLGRASSKLKSGSWEKNGGFEIRGRDIGVIGVGFVGSEVVRLLSAFGARLHLNDVRDVSEIAKKYGASIATKEEIYSKCEIVTVHVPSSKETRKMIDTAVLAKMKPSAFVVNTSRGDVVDQAALKQALIAKKIAGAAIDVYETEPCEDRELLALENLFCTPHICGNSEEAVLAMGRAAISNLKRGSKL
ncbi:MAG: phosphoglycerate dehydrogenase [Bdellovibrionota bacterium]